MQKSWLNVFLVVVSVALTAVAAEFLVRWLDKSGEINQLWNKWLGPNTEYKMVRTDKVMPLAEMKFTPIP